MLGSIETDFGSNTCVLKHSAILLEGARGARVVLREMEHREKYSHFRKGLVHALARFALQIQTNRRNWFRQLSTEANKKTLAAKLAVVQHAFDSVWI